jgi:hypothetical protein
MEMTDMAQINTSITDSFPASARTSSGKVTDEMSVKRNASEAGTSARLPYSTSGFHGFGEYCEELESMHWRC